MKASIRSFGIALFIAGAAMSLIDMKDDSSKKEATTVSAKSDKQAHDKLEKQIKQLEKDNASLTAQLKKQPKQPPADQPEVINYTLEVKAGMGTSEVSKALETAKIIKDSDEFEALLINDGLSSKIQLGKNKLKSSMTSEEIIKLITSRK